MFPTNTPFRHEKKTQHIELRIKRISQLFNSLDPSPFIEKDLDDDAVEFIVSYVKEFGLSSDSVILIHLPPHLKGKVRENDVKKAINNFFSYKSDIFRKEVRMKIVEGQKSLVIGLVFLASCLLVRNLFFSDASSVISAIISEGLMIGGWVGMWNPISNILYDWRPMSQQKNIYEKLANMPVEFTYY